MNHMETAKWAAKMADAYNQPIKYILLNIHEALYETQDIEQAKENVRAKLEAVS